ncbi:four helix bundle protein [Candidatus Microgenomates bacterium]|nr:four helix bundle protein [Candidatus Microgenomates bacterium]
MRINKFTDLEVWKEAHKLTLLIYQITANFPKEEMYGLVSQLRRAVISIESCIAEGFSRYHYKDRLNFYYDARGSVAEVQSQSITAKDLGFMSESDFQKVFAQAEKVGIILGGLIRSTENLSKK